MAVSELEKKPESKMSKAKIENNISGDTLFNEGDSFFDTGGHVEENVGLAQEK
ncbi:MAG: hypothetical protein ACI90U_001667 [Pseudomonadales bacterium]|jgi:hypothetical protein